MILQVQCLVTEVSFRFYVDCFEKGDHHPLMSGVDRKVMVMMIVSWRRWKMGKLKKLMDEMVDQCVELNRQLFYCYSVRELLLNLMIV